MTQFGSKLEALEEAARHASRLKFSFKIDTPPGYTEVNVDIRSKGPSWDVSVTARRREPGQSRSLPLRSMSPSQKLLEIGKQLPEGRVMWDSLEVTSSKSPLKGSALKGAVMEALAEVFPKSTPATAHEAHSSDERIMTLLRGAAATRDTWNALSDAEKGALGSYRGLDLSGLDLARFRLGSLDFEGADFSRCSLQNAELAAANLNHCRFIEADLSESFCFDARFHSANFERANLERAVLREAKLRSTNLTGASLRGADLQGADFSKANLTHAVLEDVVAGPYTSNRAGTRYDASTKFPAGFSPGSGWVMGPGKS